MADWVPYNACCHLRALESDTAFCPDCGHALYRCVAFAECRSLAEPLRHCPVCVAPQLFVDAEAVLEGRVGDRLSIPLVLKNGSTVRRPLSVLNVMQQEPGRDPKPVPLSWQALDPSQERSFALDTAPLTDSGVYRVGLVLVLSSSYQGIDEQYAFTAAVTLHVHSAEQQQIVQHIDMSGAQIGTGGMIVASPAMHQAMQPGGTRERRERLPATLERAERYEILSGVRGYRESAIRLARHTEFVYEGFRADECPPPGALRGARPVLRFGRNSRRFDARRNPEPNDVCLRVYDSANATLDSETSMRISRHHFELRMQNDRLYLHALSPGGTGHQGEVLDSGALRVVRDGDVISPLPGRSHTLAVQVRFAAEQGTVERVRLQRLPALS